MKGKHLSMRGERKRTSEMRGRGDPIDTDDEETLPLHTAHSLAQLINPSFPVPQKYITKLVLKSLQIAPRYTQHEFKTIGLRFYFIRFLGKM